MPQKELSKDSKQPTITLNDSTSYTPAHFVSRTLRLDCDENSGAFQTWNSDPPRRRRRRSATPPTTEAVLEDNKASFLRLQINMLREGSIQQEDAWKLPSEDFGMTSWEKNLDQLKLFLTAEHGVSDWWPFQGMEDWGREVFRRALWAATREIRDVLTQSVEERMDEAESVNIEIFDKHWQNRDADLFNISEQEFNHAFDGFTWEDIIEDMEFMRRHIAWMKDCRDALIESVREIELELARSPNMVYEFPERGSGLELQDSQYRRRDRECVRQNGVHLDILEAMEVAKAQEEEEERREKRMKLRRAKQKVMKDIEQEKRTASEWWEWNPQESPSIGMKGSSTETMGETSAVLATSDRPQPPSSNTRPSITTPPNPQRGGSGHARPWDL